MSPKAGPIGAPSKPIAPVAKGPPIAAGPAGPLIISAGPVDTDIIPG